MGSYCITIWILFSRSISKTVARGCKLNMHYWTDSTRNKSGNSKPSKLDIWFKMHLCYQRRRELCIGYPEQLDNYDEIETALNSDYN